MQADWNDPKKGNRVLETNGIAFYQDRLDIQIERKKMRENKA